MRNFVDYYIKYTERLRFINDAVESSPHELIRQMEEQYSKRIKEIADFIISNGSGRKIVMITGPSGSGKTTTANMLLKMIEGCGINAIRLSLDEFFKGEGKAPLLQNGSYDYESVDALNVPALQDCLTKLLTEGSCMMPRFDFSTKKPFPQTFPVNVGKDDVIIVEGIHALNTVVTNCLPEERTIKIYISVKQGIMEGDDEVISAHEIRFLRRMVRDYRFRSSIPERTFDMWPQVMRGEKLYIDPYKCMANVTINSIHIYEVNVMAEMASKMLSNVASDSQYYAEAQRYIEKLRLFKPLDSALVPESSMVREFIGSGKIE